MVKDRQEMETSVLMSFWYPYMALRMGGVPLHSTIQEKCPQFDTFYMCRSLNV